MIWGCSQKTLGQCIILHMRKLKSAGDKIWQIYIVKMKTNRLVIIPGAGGEAAIWGACYPDIPAGRVWYYKDKATVVSISPQL